MTEGKYLRFPEIFSTKYPIIICPIDDLLISGPVNGLENPAYKINRILESKPTAILTFYGTVKKYHKQFVNQKFIINLSASTTRSTYTKKVILGTIDLALRLNANAVAFHINICSKYAPQMISDAGIIIEEADKYGLPTVGIIYPRGENQDGSTNDNYDLKENDNSSFTELVGHCVQLGVDLGVDLIKTQYTGSMESFVKVITVAQGTPVVTAGGPLIEKSIAVNNAFNAYKAGAAGISFARNVFGREDPKDFIDEIKKTLK